MILILSQEDNEPATDLVMEHLMRKNAQFLRINGEDLTNNEHQFYVKSNSKGKGYSIAIDNVEYDLSNVNVVWYRRWNTMKYLGAISKSNFNGREATRHSIKEFNVFSEFLFDVLGQDVKWLTHPKYSEDNKLVTLSKAHEFGLKVPKFLITNNKADLLSFYQECKEKLIIKPMGNSYYFFKGDHVYSHYTERLSMEMIDQLPETFMFSHFQEEITRQYEMRVFFLENSFFPITLFTGNDGNDHPDIKQHHAKKTLRRVPSQLPSGLQIKLRQLMRSINLNTGSIDLIIDQNDQFYFLEVNPIGIFSDNSYYCNLGLEEKVANYLIQNDQS